MSYLVIQRTRNNQIEPDFYQDFRHVKLSYIHQIKNSKQHLQFFKSLYFHHLKSREPVA